MIVELSRTSLLQRIEAAKRGQWIMYHVGFLFSDRTKGRRLNSTAGEAWAQYELGTVVLVQRRLGDMQYEYYVVKR
jgi:hypothetical protein